MTKVIKLKGIGKLLLVVNVKLDNMMKPIF
jgi:hypothetical protein